MNVTQFDINDFVSQRSFAIVGVSRSARKFGNTIYKTLKQRGYRLYPVHPDLESVEGDRCFRSLESLPEKVGGVVLCVSPLKVEETLLRVEAAGIRRVWMQQGSESYAAIRFCERAGISAVHGQCILMFTEPVQGVHRFHRWIWRMIGKHPSPQKDPANPAS